MIESDLIDRFRAINGVLKGYADLFAAVELRLQALEQKQEDDYWYQQEQSEYPTCEDNNSGIEL